MFRYVATILVSILLSPPLVAGITPFPTTFHTQMVPTNGTRLYVRVGGKGPAVVLLHGFGFTGDMWAPLAIVLAKDHTVIVPDLRGMGMSAHPDTGYTKKNHHAGVCHRCREVFRQEHGRSYAVRRQHRHGRHRAQLRALDHGGESTGHHQVGYRFPRPELNHKEKKQQFRRKR